MPVTGRADQIHSGNVSVVPAVKLVMMKSSIDSANASSAPAITPGMISGRVTSRNVVHGPAPRSLRGLLERRVEADHPGPHGDRDERRCRT